MESWPGKCREDFFSVSPLRYLLAITYQQANQLSHWPCALWHSLVQHVTVMEGWACPGVHCSHREYMGHNQWVARLVCTRESSLVCSAPGEPLPASPPAKTLIPPFSLPVILFLLPWISEEKLELESGWAEWCHVAQASTQGIMGPTCWVHRNEKGSAAAF